MTGNPLDEFIDLDTYRKLHKMGFLNERAVRDYYIRKQFNSMRSRFKPMEIIHHLQEEFPYLTIESVRKIAYTKAIK